MHSMPAAVLFLTAAAFAAAGPSWRRDDFNDPAHLPLAVPNNPRLHAEIKDGKLLLADRGTQPGDMITCVKQWGAHPEAGASCRARVKVVRCQGLAGVMIGFSDGVHEDILTLYPDRIKLYRAGLEYAMDTTDDFHEYRIDIRGTDVHITVDSVPAIDGPGAFTFPAYQGRNRLSIGGGASASLGEAWWDWLSWTDGLEAWVKANPVLPGAEHVVVFKEAGIYAPFPSLRRDPKTGFFYTTFQKKRKKTHYETAAAVRGIMESRDGGRTWHAVSRLPKGLVGPRPGEVFRCPDGALVGIRQTWRRWFPPERLKEFKGRYRTSTQGAEKPGWFSVLSGGRLTRSEDGGKTWKNTPIPDLDTYVSCSSGWSCVQLRDGRVLRAFMVRRNARDSGDVYAVITADGKRADVVRVMGDPEEKLRFTEETLVYETSKGVIWMLTRVEGGDDHLWQAVSRDGGSTWTSRKTGIKGHPPSGLVKLRDGRLVLTYGYRHLPYGIRAVLSRDEGLTWDTKHIITLRNDGANYDLGYPRSMLLDDGRVLTIYYFVTAADHITHIACTLWQPPPAAAGFPAHQEPHGK